MDIYALLLIGHLIGTILAVGGATMIEVHLNKALADKNMSGDERAMLGGDFSVLRVGLVLSVFTGVGFIVLYVASGQEFRFLSPVFWAKMTILFLVVVNALLLQAHKVSLYWGSAISFVGWWSVMITGFFLTGGVRFGYFEIVGTFVFAVVAGAFLLHKIREFIQSKHV